MDRAEFDVAFQKAKQKYPDIHVHIAWRFILDFEAAHEANKARSTEGRQPFGLLISLQLDHALLYAEHDRTMYSALIGYLFGKRGQYSIARKKKNKLPATKRKRKQPVPTYDIAIDGKGQLAWRL